jgi:hypothetical protein
LQYTHRARADSVDGDCDARTRGKAGSVEEDCRGCASKAAAIAATEQAGSRAEGTFTVDWCDCCCLAGEAVILVGAAAAASLTGHAKPKGGIIVLVASTGMDAFSS